MVILKVLLLSIVLLALVMVGLAVKILFKKDGKFPNTHVGGNKHLRKQGVYCAQTEDKIEQAKAQKETKYKNLRFVGKS